MYLSITVSFFYLDIYYEDISAHFRLQCTGSRYLAWQLCVFLVISVVQ